MKAPFYAPETVRNCMAYPARFLSGRCSRNREFNAASEIWDLLSAIRGHNMAKGAIDSAVWDAEAKQKNVPLWKLLGGVRSEIACGVSIGIKDTIDELVSTVERELAAGYQRIKIKIKPGKDIEPVMRLRERFPQVCLMVDANSAYRLQDVAHLKRLDDYYLMMIEQPLGWDDLYSHAELQRKLDTPICLTMNASTVKKHAYFARGHRAARACRRSLTSKMGRVGGYTPSAAYPRPLPVQGDSRLVRRHAGDPA